MADTGVYDFLTWRCWLALDDERRREFLASAWCPRCQLTSIADGYDLTSDAYKVSVVGRCACCGAPVRRTVKML